MNGEFRAFLGRIEFNENIKNEQKQALLDFIKYNLFSKVSVFSADEYDKLYRILKDYDYDIYMFENLLDKTYIIRNSIGKNNYSTFKPKADYVYAIHTIFEKLNMNIIDYNENFPISNIALARTAYKMSLNDDILNNEISFVDLTKKISDIYYQNNDSNKIGCVVLKLLHRVDMGLKEFNGKYKNVVNSKEFISMFENYILIDDLHFSDLIKDFYPVFENELFALIKEGAKSHKGGKPNTEYIFKYLDNIKRRREEFSRKKDKIVKNITKIDIDTKKRTEDVFSDLIESIGNNGLNVSVNKNIINNINNIFEEYSGNQRSFLDEKLTSFFDNCSNFINDFIVPSDNRVGIDELISDLVGECKDFFIEYDSKKFKEIIDYILGNTNLSVDNLRDIGKKCSAFFKDADVEKLKEINTSLNEFKDYVNKTFNDNELINNNIFDSILINDPDLLLKKSNILDILGFLKGEISLSDRGYHYRNMILDNGFFSLDFYKKIIDNDYKILFEANLNRIINNLNYLEGKCNGWDIDFKKFKFNEDMIYFLLDNDLYDNLDNSLDNLFEIFDGDAFKRVVELNPELLLMPKGDLEIVINRCILNENSDYNFYDLLVSELYYYRIDEFKDKNSSELENKIFKYINIGIDISRNFDVEEVLTSNVVSNKGALVLIDAYYDRNKKINELNSLLLDLEKENDIVVGLNPIIERIVMSYDSVYGKVPCISFKNKLIDFITDKKDYYEYKISSDRESLDFKKEKKSMYSSQKKDSLLAIKKLNEVISQVDSVEVKADLIKFLEKFSEEHKSKNELKEEEIAEEIKEIELNLRILDREVEFLNYLLTVVDFEDDSLFIDSQTKKKTFSISDLSNCDNIVQTNYEEEISNLLDGKNIIIFSDSVDLSSIPNDKNFVDKINKFLGETDFSIRSIDFMKNNTLNNGCIEKYSVPRNGIWARRENGTPVRIYFIPAYTKYFTCYYVIGVNYKDHSHLDGGCSNDDVYKRVMQKAKFTELMIDELGIEEAIRFIKEKNEEYEEKMKPIISKIEIYEKKKNSKK